MAGNMANHNHESVSREETAVDVWDHPYGESAKSFPLVTMENRPLGKKTYPIAELTSFLSKNFNEEK